MTEYELKLQKARGDLRVAIAYLRKVLREKGATK